MDATTSRNACYNKPRPVKDHLIEVQSGWREVTIPGLVSRIPVMTKIPFVMTTPCVYTQTTADAHCEGCEHSKDFKKECSHDWKEWPIAANRGTKWCPECGKVQKTNGEEK